ncbi:MAG: hypothetical protein HRT47_12960 [Candidatus Caenarcaniphilales bacterium]|nr:hypothetical protein [Candidatus Caenarcaniphilales bacterium]
MGFEDFLSKISNSYNNTSETMNRVYNPEPVDSSVNGVSYSRSNIDLVRNRILGLDANTGGGEDFLDPSIGGDDDLTTLAVGEEEDAGIYPPPIDEIYDGDDQDISMGSRSENIIVDGDNNYIKTNAGHDSLHLIGDDNDVSLGSGHDSALIEGHSNSINTGSGHDFIEVGFEFDLSEISGGSGYDTVALQGLEHDYEVSQNEANGDKNYNHLASGQELSITRDVENVYFTGNYPAPPNPPSAPNDGGSSNIPNINLRDLFGNG